MASPSWSSSGLLPCLILWLCFLETLRVRSPACSAWHRTSCLPECSCRINDTSRGAPPAQSQAVNKQTVCQTAALSSEVILLPAQRGLFPEGSTHMALGAGFIETSLCSPVQWGKEPSSLLSVRTSEAGGYFGCNRSQGTGSHLCVSAFTQRRCS